MNMKYFILAIFCFLLLTAEIEGRRKSSGKSQGKSKGKSSRSLWTNVAKGLTVAVGAAAAGVQLYSAIKNVEANKAVNNIEVDPMQVFEAYQKDE